MSAQTPPRHAPRPRKPLPSAINVVVGTLGLFLVVLTLLALQVRLGKDPSLSQASGTGGTSGAGSSSAATARKVVTKTS